MNKSISLTKSKTELDQLSKNITNNQPDKDNNLQTQQYPTYTSPTLRFSDENPSGKLGGNACCSHC